MRVTRATLETLGERLFGGASGNLAAQLPEEIGRYLLQPLSSEDFGVDDFFPRVSLREGGTPVPEAIFHTRVVVEVVREAVSPGAFEHVRAQLPSEYNRLFELGSERTTD